MTRLECHGPMSHTEAVFVSTGISGDNRSPLAHGSYPDKPPVLPIQTPEVSQPKRPSLRARLQVRHPVLHSMCTCQ